MKLVKILIYIIFVGKLYSQEIIQMEKINNIYQIPCKVNGIPMKLIFDTGASNVSISITEAKFLIKQGLIATEDFLGNVNYQMANGGIVQGEKFIIRSIKIGNKEISNVEATIMYNQDAPLLLGQSAISKLGKYSIKDNELIIENNSLNSIDVLEGFKSLKFNSQVEDFNSLKFLKENDTFSIYELTQFDKNLNEISEFTFDLIFLSFHKSENNLKRISLYKGYEILETQEDHEMLLKKLNKIVKIFENIFGKSKVEINEEKVIRHYWNGNYNTLNIILRQDNVGKDDYGKTTNIFNLEVKLIKL